MALLAASLAWYAALVSWLAWPLPAQIGTHLPDTWWTCEVDALHMGWALAHESHALVSAPARFLDGNIFHPTRHALFYGTTGLGALPYFAPVFWLTGNPALALNLVLLLGTTLTAWTTHLVVQRWTGLCLAGLIAGSTLLTTRWLLWGLAPTAPQYALVHYVPLIIFLAARPAPRFSATLPLVALVVLQSLVDVVYLATAVMVPIGVLSLVRLVRRETRGAGLRLTGALALAGLALVPVYLGHLAVRADNPGLRGQTFWSAGGPPIELPWGVISGHLPTALPDAALLAIAAGGISMVFARTRSHAWGHALFWAALGVLMMLKPVPPSRASLLLEQWLPPLAILRVPNRLGIAGLVGLAILAGLAYAEGVRRFDGWLRWRLVAAGGRLGLVILLGGAMYADYRNGLDDPARGRLPLPPGYPLRPAITAEGPIMALLSEPGGPLLELPVGRGGREEARLQARAVYRSIFHRRPVLNGYSGYWPSQFPARMALARRLPDPNARAALRSETGLEVVLVHLDELAAPEREAWLAASGGRAGWRLVARDGDQLLFTVGDGPGPPP